MNISIRIKPAQFWIEIPCRNIMDKLILTERYFDQKDFKPVFNDSQIELRLTYELIAIFNVAPRSFPCLIEIDQQLVAGGFLENTYTTTPSKLIDNQSSWRASFTIRDWTAWFDFELEESFNPFADLDIFEDLYVCNPFEQNKSILHKLFIHLQTPFSLDSELIIGQKTRSFVIKEKENVLETLKILFWGLRRFFWIDPAGRFRSEFIKTSPESSENLPLIGCYSKLIKKTPNKSYTDILVEFATVEWKSAIILKAEKKSVWQATGQGLDANNKPNPLTKLIPQAVYPAGSLDIEEWIKPKGDFLQTNYDMSYLEQGIFGQKSPINKDISIVGLSNYLFNFQAQEKIKEIYFRPRIDSFAFQLQNIYTMDDEGSVEDKVQIIDYMDAYADSLYRTRRNKIFEAKPKTRYALRKAGRSLIDIESRPLQATTEIFLEYVNDSQTAKDFFDRQQSLLKLCNDTFSFQGKEKLDVNNFYVYQDPTGFEYVLLITSCKIDFSRCFNEGQVQIYEYTAISDFPVKEYDKGEEGGEGGSEQPPPDIIYTVSNKYDSLEGYIKTDYVNDETALLSLDDQIVVFGGQMRLLASVFFGSPHEYKAQVLFVSGATMRKRPLSEVAFSNLESVVNVVSRRGMTLQCDLSVEDESVPISLESNLFKWV